MINKDFFQMDTQTQIIRILFENNKQKNWLADKLRISAQKIDYMLNKAKKISHEDYNQIMEIFKKEGFITSNSEQCNHLYDQTIEINSVIGHTLTILNGNVKKFTDDNVLDFREKRKLTDMIDKIRNEFNAELDSIESIIEGRI
jgi:Zn-dependent peptidase ImmA (M78 family)